MSEPNGRIDEEIKAGVIRGIRAAGQQNDYPNVYHPVSALAQETRKSLSGYNPSEPADRTFSLHERPTFDAILWDLIAEKVIAFKLPVQTREEGLPQYSLRPGWEDKLASYAARS